MVSGWSAFTSRYWRIMGVREAISRAPVPSPALSLGVPTSGVVSPEGATAAFTAFTCCVTAIPALLSRPDLWINEPATLPAAFPYHPRPTFRRRPAENPWPPRQPRGILPADHG